MSNNVNYATVFDKQLRQKYTRELLTSGLTTANVNFFGANTIKVPFLSLKGYKDHDRGGGFNRQSVSNGHMVKTLAHDRDVEFFVDAMDVDETNQVMAATNITNIFETEHAIPETDAYRISKVYADFAALGGGVDARLLSSENVLEVFDGYMQAMDEAEAPMDGRILYVTPAVNKQLAQAGQISRFMEITGQAGKVNRNVRMLDEVEVVVVPSSRMKSAYDFSDGFTPASGAKQIHMLLISPQSVIACNKHSYIKLWPPGSHTCGDGYLYQNRQYGDVFVIDTRISGIAVNAS